jgi:hypothetical protein
MPIQSTICICQSEVLINYRVKYISSTGGLQQNQISTWIFKSVTNGTCGKQINSLGTSAKIMLGFLMERYVTLTRDVIPGFLGVTSYLKNKKIKIKTTKKNKKKGSLGTP